MNNRFSIKIVDKTFRRKGYSIYDNLHKVIYLEKTQTNATVFRVRELAYQKRDELNRKWNSFIEKGTLKRL